MIHVMVAPGSLEAGKMIPLPDDEEHHLLVRRVPDRTFVTALDGAGVVAKGRVQKLGKRWTLEVGEVHRVPAPSETILAVGAGDRERFQQVIEKSTELGVTRVIPLVTSRSVQVATHIREGAIAKLRRFAVESCKQCGNPWAPVVDFPMALSAFVASPPVATWLLADPAGERAPQLGREASIGWLIGPEGGFTEEESLILTRDVGANHVRLGPHVLRFETAAVAAATLTLDRRGHG